MSENEIKALVEKIKKLEVNLASEKAERQELEKRIEKLETGSLGTGVYLDGVPEYAQNYILSDNTKKKEGE